MLENFYIFCSNGILSLCITFCVWVQHIKYFYFVLVLLKGLNGENLVALAPVSTLALKVCAFLFCFRGLPGYLKWNSSMLSPHVFKCDCHHGLPDSGEFSGAKSNLSFSPWHKHTLLRSYTLTKFEYVSQSLHPNIGLFSLATWGAWHLEGKQYPLNVTLHLFHTITQDSLQTQPVNIHRCLLHQIFFPFLLFRSPKPWNAVPSYGKRWTAWGPVGYPLWGDVETHTQKCTWIIMHLAIWLRGETSPWKWT